jgi:predicted PurR-regulated permease PerM
VPDFITPAAADDARPPAAVPPPGAPELRALLSLAVAALVIAALFIAQDVLLPIILAVMVSFVLSPLVTALGRVGLSRAFSVILTILIAFGVAALGAALLAREAAALATDAPRYAAALQEKLESIELLATSELSSVTRMFGRDPAAPVAPVTNAPPPAIAARPQDAAALSAAASARKGEPVLVEVARSNTSPLLAVRSMLEPVLGPLETTVIVLVIAIFILMEREDLRDRVIRLAGADDLHRTTAAMDDAGQRLSRYFLSQVAVNGAFGLVIGIGLWAIGIPSAALWAVLAGLLRFVPYVGPILAAVPPLALAAAVSPGWWLVAEVALLFAIVEPATGYVVEPLLYGHSTGLAPVSVIVAAVFWTWVWGPIGLILSTPLTLCLVVLGRHMQSLEFLDVLLGDRPALAPIENLYQRILADNPDEVLEKADALLEERTLLDYYDGIVLPALKLAAQDQARGLIPPERATRMTRSLLDVIADLNDHEDVPQRGPAANSDHTVTERARTAAGGAVRGQVACVAGHGAFDDAVAAMLAQLLARAGVGSRHVPHTDVSRDRIPRFDLSATSVIALSYLDMTGSLSHLRYLVRRLRQHAPGARIIVGLWPAGDVDAGNVSRREAIAADQYVGSLREAVDAVSAAARRAA